MELRHLRYFVAVAEECHFGRAAQRLHMAPSPLSRQIRELERAVGAPLLERTTRSVELTPAGDRFLERCRLILRDVEDAVRPDATPTGRVRIGFTGSATYAVLPGLSAGLKARYPGVALDLRGEMLTPAQVGALLTGDLDVAILRPPVRDPRVRVHLLRSEPLLAVMPAGHPLCRSGRPVALADLAGEDFVAHPSGGRSALQETVVLACAAAGFRPRVVAELAQTSAVISCVAAGLGVALVPASSDLLRIAGAEYRHLEGDPVQVPLAIAVRATGASPLALSVRDHVRTLQLT